MMSLISRSNLKDARDSGRNLLRAQIERPRRCICALALKIFYRLLKLRLHLAEIWNVFVDLGLKMLFFEEGVGFVLQSLEKRLPLCDISDVLIYAME